MNTVWKLLDDLKNKVGISEIVINDPKTVFVERDGRFIQLNVKLTGDDMFEFCSQVGELNDQQCDSDSPLLDGNLEDGSRINIVMPPFAKSYPAITIRKYLPGLKSFESAPGVFGLNPKWVQFLQALVYSRCNLVVSGGTGMGKTTFMNLMLNEIPKGERIVSIEDTYELNINLPNSVRLEVKKGQGTFGPKITARDLVKNTLRMRPDRIIIGEVRGGELFDLLQAMNTGHDGSMTTVHANSAAECLSRFENLFMLAGFDVPYHVVRKQIGTAIDFVIQLSRNREGKRVVSQISEVTGVDRDQILMQDIGLIEGDMLHATGITPKRLQTICRYGGLPLDFFNDKNF